VGGGGGCVGKAGLLKAERSLRARSPKFLNWRTEGTKNGGILKGKGERGARDSRAQVLNAELCRGGKREQMESVENDIGGGKPGKKLCLKVVMGKESNRVTGKGYTKRLK